MQPAKITARPEVVIDVMTAACWLEPCVQRGAAAGDDEEHVVDADADADHRGHLGAKSGTSSTLASSVMRLNPMPRPTTAMRMGRPIASSEPKLTSRVSAATRRPMPSELNWACSRAAEPEARQLDLQVRTIDLLAQRDSAFAFAVS